MQFRYSLQTSLITARLLHDFSIAKELLSILMQVSVTSGRYYAQF